MNKWMNMIGSMLKIFVLFTGFTILFYYAMIWVNLEYSEYHRYDEPEGSAQKVTKMLEEQQGTWFQRLIFFYLHGE